MAMVRTGAGDKGLAYLVVLLVAAAAAIGVLLLRFNLRQMHWLATPLTKAGFRCADVKALLVSVPFDRLSEIDFAEQMASYYGEQAPPLRLASGETLLKVAVYCPPGCLQRVDASGSESTSGSHLRLYGIGEHILAEYAFEPASVVQARGFGYFETATARDLESGLTVICEAVVHSPTGRRVQRIDWTDAHGGVVTVRFVHPKIPKKPVLAGALDRVTLPTCRISTRFGDVLLLDVTVELPGKPRAVLCVRSDGVLSRADQTDGRPMTVGGWLGRSGDWRQHLVLVAQSERTASMVRAEERRALANWVGVGAILVLFGSSLGIALPSRQRRETRSAG